MEYQIIPALKSGFIVLADRYIYTAIARGIVRGADPEWLKDLYGFAVVPDLVCYLKLSVKELIPRVLETGKMNYWESGMDTNFGDDMYDSFVAYQGALIHEFDRMADEHDFVTLDAREEAQVTQKQLRRAVAEYLEATSPGGVMLR